MKGQNYVFSGGSFGSGFAAGAVSSAVGSGEQLAGVGNGGMLAASAFSGGIASWVAGGNFLSGAMQGLCVGLLNHAQPHDGVSNDDNSSDEEFMAQLQEEYGGQAGVCKMAVCVGRQSFTSNVHINLEIGSTIFSGVGSFGKSLQKFSQNTTIGDNGMFYYAKNSQSPFFGNQYIRTKNAAAIGKNIKINSNKVGNKLGILQVATGFAQDYQTYQNTGTFELYHTGRSGASWAGSWAAAEAALYIGGELGTAIGGPAGGIILGTIFGIGGALGGSALGENIYEYYWFK